MYESSSSLAIPGVRKALFRLNMAEFLLNICKEEFFLKLHFQKLGLSLNLLRFICSNK